MMSSHHLNSKNNVAVFLLKTVLSSVAADDKDGSELKLEKIGPFFFQVLMPCLQ